MEVQKVTRWASDERKKNKGGVFFPSQDTSALLSQSGAGSGAAGGALMIALASTPALMREYLPKS